MVYGFGPEESWWSVGAAALECFVGAGFKICCSLTLVPRLGSGQMRDPASVFFVYSHLLLKKKVRRNQKERE